ncbi:MAG: dipeptide epimerase [Bacteroidetes bacterium]|nr:dipeptide epimerase [Bacteroidota bacterium]
MKIASVKSRREDFGLVRPYTIASKGTTSDVSNMIVEIELENGISGLGSASPTDEEIGEDINKSEEVLAAGQLEWLVGQEIGSIEEISIELRKKMFNTPASRAAVDIALYDAWSLSKDVPLVDLLGRHHEELPTSITIGIKSIEESIEEAQEYVSRGFKIIKLKTGFSADEDTATMRKLRENIDNSITIRVDANQGYDSSDYIKFIEGTRNLNVEFVEQPFDKKEIDKMRDLPEEYKSLIAADESLQNEEDAELMATDPRACGIYNIKLMKSGGINSAMKIATIAQRANIDLMWGCMDESRISIAAGLHAAFACPNTKYIDLDGSLDLARDIVEGGFEIKDGVMRTINAPGLGLIRIL